MHVLSKAFSRFSLCDSRMYFLYSALTSVVQTVAWLLFYMWCALLVYNIMSALFGFCRLRRAYVGLLRQLYTLFGFSKRKRRAFSQQNRPMENAENPNTSELSALLRAKSFRTFNRDFRLADACDLVQSGIKVVVDDEVTKCFTTEELEEWNFLNRTRLQSNLDMRMEALLILSMVFRFALFLVIRLPIGITSLVWLVGTMVVFSVLEWFFPGAYWKMELERYCTMVCSRMIAAAFSAVITVHNKENRAKLGSVVVANHTTPIDIVMLAVDNCFTLVGQRHGGFTGMIQYACSLAQRHIWFERKIAEDRKMVAERLKEHISNPRNNPILIFPEGTCINNTGVFMFKKGCFELGATIYPVVIKYHRAFADPFWNSQEQNMLTYIMMLMTSWAIVCDIHYLEPTSIKKGETAIEFAERVKADICQRGGLVDLPWDGMIKRPGCESYLKKLVEDERKAISRTLLVSTADDDSDDGLVMHAGDS